MFAQKGHIAELAAADVAALSAFPSGHNPDDRLGDSTAPRTAIALSSTIPVVEAPDVSARVTELEIPNLAHASVVCSTIAKGRIVVIDSAAAFRVNGVVSILTHQNLPDIVDDHGREVETASAGPRFRLLQDQEIAFKGQPVALVVARTPEIARHAASLVHVEYERDAADGYAQRDAATKSDDPMELGVSTAIFESPCRISIRDTVQGAQDLRQYLYGRFGSGLRPQFQAMLAARAALALRCSVRVVLTLQQMRDFACVPRRASAPGAA